MRSELAAVLHDPAVGAARGVRTDHGAQPQAAARGALGAGAARARRARALGPTLCCPARRASRSTVRRAVRGAPGAQRLRGSRATARGSTRRPAGLAARRRHAASPPGGAADVRDRRHPRLAGGAPPERRPSWRRWPPRSRTAGPDGAGHHLDGVAGLAIRRLALVDPEHGDQPMANEDGAVHVVCNGEIYNHRALRRELERRGHAFRTGSDVEVLVHLYEERGPAFVDGLRGMFALALWDARRAPPRAGARPVRHQAARLRAARSGRLAFASELKALLALPGFPRDIDPEAVEEYLALNAVPAPRDDLPRRAQARARPPADRRRRPACASSATRGRGRSPRPSCAREPLDELAAGDARAAGELRARAPGRRRAGRRAALRRRGLGPDHRARPAAPAEDVQRRLRRRARSTSSPARARSPSATAPTTTSCGSGPRRRPSSRASRRRYDEPSRRRHRAAVLAARPLRRAGTSRPC